MVKYRLHIANQIGGNPYTMSIIIKFLKEVITYLTEIINSINNPRSNDTEIIANALQIIIPQYYVNITSIYMQLSDVYIKKGPNLDYNNIVDNTSGYYTSNPINGKPGTYTYRDIRESLYKCRYAVSLMEDIIITSYKNTMDNLQKKDI